eukprot:g4616.t1
MPREVRDGGRALNRKQGKAVDEMRARAKKRSSGQRFGGRVDNSVKVKPAWMQNEQGVGKARKMEAKKESWINDVVRNINKVTPVDDRSMSPDDESKEAAPVYYNGQLKHWNHEGCHSCPHEDGEQDSVIANNNKPVICLALSGDGTRIITGSIDRSVQIYELARESRRGKMEGSFVVGFDRTKGGHRDVVNAVAYSRDNEYAASASEAEVKLWKPKALELHGTLKGHKNNVSALTFTPDHRHLVSGGLDWAIRVWHVESKECVHEIARAHNSGVMRFSWVPDGTKLLTGSYDNTIKMWDFEVHKDEDEPEKEEDWTVTYDDLHTFKAHSGGVHAVVMSWDGNILVSGSADRKLIIWDTNHKDMTRKLMGGVKSTLEPKYVWEDAHDGIIYDCAIPKNDECIVSCGEDNKIKIWARISKELLHIYKCNYTLGGVVALALTPDDKTMIVSGKGELEEIDLQYYAFLQIWIWPAHKDLWKESTVDFDALEGRKVEYTIWFTINPRDRDICIGPLKSYDMEVRRGDKRINNDCLIRKGRRGEWVERKSLPHAPFDVADKETRWYYIDYGNYCLRHDPYNTQQMRTWAEAKRFKRYTLIRKGYDGAWVPYEDTGGVPYFVAEMRGTEFDKEAQEKLIDEIEAKRLGKRKFKGNKENATKLDYYKWKIQQKLDSLRCRKDNVKHYGRICITLTILVFVALFLMCKVLGTCIVFEADTTKKVEQNGVEGERRRNLVGRRHFVNDE